MKILKLLIRLFLGGFFIFSGVSKLLGMDAFEVYLFQLSKLPFDWAAFSARLLVAVEIFLGLLLMIKLKWNSAWRASVFLLLVFSVFLILQIAKNNTENCFCLGELMDLSPTESLVKNGLFLLLLFWVRHPKNLPFYSRGNLFAFLIFLVSLSIPLITSPPDFFYQKPNETRAFDQIALDENFEKNAFPDDLRQGKKLVSFYSTRCKFCKMSSSKISVIVEKENIPMENVATVFVAKKDSTIQHFYDETGSLDFRHISIENSDFLKITRGRFPLTLLLENGEVKHKMSYRDLDEGVIREFFERP